jgi:hypothetical protein
MPINIVYSDDESVNRQIKWMINYLIEEGFSGRHLEALCWIVGLFNECEESEREIFEFAAQLYNKYAA